ncbi:hypothetical protein AVEN_126323-1 [Araneus ventricosus]|uniref:Uncharacterized protein n=1 Tax=Araneus ventricosus TaxID=182803 RepID=A0A4Y2FD57_ARAVE|nr:hypothetical protein AVEN_126323-1 [Araneus ventricosus]
MSIHMVPCHVPTWKDSPLLSELIWSTTTYRISKRPEKINEQDRVRREDLPSDIPEDVLFFLERCQYLLLSSSGQRDRKENFQKIFYLLYFDAVVDSCKVFDNSCSPPQLGLNRSSCGMMGDEVTFGSWTGGMLSLIYLEIACLILDRIDLLVGTVVLAVVSIFIHKAF